MLMSSKTRILEIKEAPLSWREMDLLTASEKYMSGVIELPFIEFVLPCFPDLDDTLNFKIAQVWRYSCASYHLQQNKEDNYSNLVKQEAALIYQQETQRILGSIFNLKNPFWKSFYARQEQENSKPLITLDALYNATGCQNPICYQLIIQVLKSIIEAHYTKDANNHYQKALRLMGDLKIPKLRIWTQQQIRNIQPKNSNNHI